MVGAFVLSVIFRYPAGGRTVAARGGAPTLPKPTVPRGMGNGGLRAVRNVRTPASERGRAFYAESVTLGREAQAARTAAVRMPRAAR
jgi:hypothetical protein